MKPAFELNTPFSVDRASSKDDDPLPYIVPDESSAAQKNSPTKTTTPQYSTSAKMAFQEPHATLLIPGPIEVEDDVLRAMAHYR